MPVFVKTGQTLHTFYMNTHTYSFYLIINDIQGKQKKVLINCRYDAKIW